MSNLKKIISVMTIILFFKTPAYADSGNIINAAGSAAMGVMILSTMENTHKGKDWLKNCSGQQWVYCAMAALAFTQAAMSLKGSKDAKKTVDASQCYGTFCSGNGVGDISTGGNMDSAIIGAANLPDDVLGQIQRDVNDNLNNLGNRGYSYNPSTNSVTTPDNGSIPAATLTSPSGLSSLGLSEPEIANIQNVAKKALDDAKKTASKFAGSSDFDTAGGGGSKIKPGPGYGSDENGFDMNKYLAGLMKKDNGARGVAGLEKKLGSDSIGVAQDNIFNMIHRRYEAKKTTLNH